MKYKSEYHSKQEQKSVLESRGMIVDDISILDRINYSHLIYVFGKHFIDNEEDGVPTYRKGTKLSNVYNLFAFNLKASSILFPFFFEVEHKLKTAVAHWFSSVDPLWYLNERNYVDYTSKNGVDNEKKKFINNIRIHEEDVRKDFDPKYYRDGKLPIWLLIDKMSFGQILMLVKFAPENIKNKVYSDFGIAPNEYKLLLVIKTFRNQIFHGNPLTADIDGFKLSKMLNYIKREWPDIFAQLFDLVDNYEYNSINIRKSEILSILKIQSIFNNK